jgi:hypothetical protein
MHRYIYDVQKYMKGAEMLFMFKHVARNVQF